MSRARPCEPSNWPAEVEYLSEPRLSKQLSPQARRAISNKPLDDTVLRRTAAPSPKVRIRSIKDTAHPAHGQHGLFASRHLPPDTLILQYLGFVHDEAEADESSNYNLSLDREAGVSVDATHMGNEARFINDYRGIAQAANAEFRDIWVDQKGGHIEKGIGIYVLGAGKSGKRAKGIAKGEEILVSYGKGFWSERQA